MADCSDVLVIAPKKSTALFILLLGSHFVALLVMVFLLKEHLLIQLFLLPLIGCSVYYYYRLHIAKTCQHAVNVACYHPQQHWSIDVVGMNDAIAVDLQGSSYRSQWWVVLNFRCRDSDKTYPYQYYQYHQWAWWQSLWHYYRGYTLLVPADSVAPEIHRQLRVALKTIR